MPKTLPDEAQDVALGASGAAGAGRVSAPLFLARSSYRRRRIRDAARLLPALGTALLFMPMLWIPGNPGSGTKEGVIYIFVIWFGLILTAMFISRRLTAPLNEGTDASAPLADAGSPSEPGARG